MLRGRGQGPRGVALTSLASTWWMAFDGYAHPGGALSVMTWLDRRLVYVPDYDLGNVPLNKGMPVIAAALWDAIA